MSNKRIYLDYAASTPVDPRVLRAMEPYFGKRFGNPGSLHSFGQEAIAAVDAAREAIADAIHADFREVVFTASATEANNLALRGAIAAWRRNSSSHPNASDRPRIVTLAIEHESIIETVRDLEREGVEVVFLPVGKDGVVDFERVVQEVADPRTAVISLMYVNNEVGTVEPIARIGEAVRRARTKQGGPYPLFHTDAAQAFQFFDCDVRELGVDMMTLSAHKIYGPKGIGALFIRGNGAVLRPGRKVDVLVQPIVTGGGQEFGVRSGTENVPLIVGFGKATEIAVAMRAREAKRVASLRDYCIQGIKKILRGAEVNGPRVKGHSSLTALLAPHIVNMYLPGISAEDAVMGLDIKGFAISSGSACRARALTPSHVIRALGYSEERAKSSIRISFGRATTKADIVRFVAAMKLFQKSRRSKI
jgi:cysteine desulfurase